MVRVVRASVSHIIQDLLPNKSESLSNRKKTDGSECPLCIDIQTLSFTAAHVEGQLAGHCQGMADLTLSCSEFSEDLGNRPSLDTAPKESVEPLRAGRYGNELASSGMHLSSGGEAHWYQFRSYQERSVSFSCFKAYNIGP